MEKTIKDRLIDVFDDLGEANQKKFKNKLCDRQKEPRVRRSATEKAADSIDLADLMVTTFTSKDAVSVSLEILEAIGCREQAAELREVTGHSSSDSVQDMPAQPSPPSNDKHFIDRNRTALIQRVNNIDAILDELYEKEIIRQEEYNAIRAEKTPQSKMRALFDGPINSAGTGGKDTLYKVLMKLQSYLMKELGAK
ncbi:apoptosis-associated speck-like protein containing a CARD isoform X2 [Myxocyprinus asiaticus]|uniref:apoptosis-associated speck-like protein containing a CARD isoform X2 n=1 Tax=Myxocyprinus asiaticus TaxID=70543 RepID=UPI00222153D3|nr:apoptosis-associated speck-like protein containing a CARD isoform X2 [Myxocyprinus asiaticus]